jgi:acyl carrier protein
LKTREEIFEKLKSILEEMFEVEPNDIVMEAQLYDQLDIDSIDAVDLIARLSEITGIRVEPEQFKSVETVNDVVEVIYSLTATG